MPWPKIEDVPANLRKHKGAPLTIEQANKWAQIFDALKANASVREPAAAAWSTWEEIYELKDGAWAKRPRAAAESMLWIEEEPFVEAIENPVIERDQDGLPSKVRVLLIQSGPARSKNRNYPAPPLKELAESGMLDGLKMYDGHPPGSEEIPGSTLKPRSIREYLSFILPKTAKFEESIRLKTGAIVSGITGIVKLIDRDFKYKMAEAAETFGISLNSLCDALKTPSGETVIQKIRRATSADWLTGEPNCGGCVLEFVEAADVTRGKEVTEEMEYKDITADDLKKNRPDLVQALMGEAQTAQAAAEQAKTAAETKATEAQAAATTAQAATATAAAESADLKTKLQAKDTEMAEMASKNAAAALTAKTIETVESKCAHLNILGKAQVMKAVLGKTFKTEQEMAEAIDAQVKGLPEASTKPAGAPAPGNAGTDPALPTGSAECAESMGFTEEERKRLAQVR